MSGIAGLVCLDGAPVDAEILGSMTRSLVSRGPDERNTWINGQAGFGHTLLKTTDESEQERQPMSLDGEIWIVADARIDAQSDLIAALNAEGHEVTAGVPDVELILRAYLVWGENCVEHLLGDFAFAIWDAPRKQLFCARDHLGVKPFFYAQVGREVVFSNALDCVRIHPAVSDRLNDLAVADFLLFGCNQELGTTVYADVERLPAGHIALWSAEGFVLRRYWTLPIDDPVYYRRSSDYVERFRELLNLAVEDRLRTDRLAIFMSGGLDSTTLAAVSCSLLRKQPRDSEVHAFTWVHDDYSEDRFFAAMVAEHLKIPIHLRIGGGDDTVDPVWSEASVHTPEPNENPLSLVKEWAWYSEVSRRSRVFFWGEGPDNALMYEWRPYLKHLVRRGRYLRAMSDVGRHVIKHRRVPLLPTIPKMVRERLDPELRRPSFPPWLKPEFETRLRLNERWADVCARQTKPSERHPVRPEAYDSFTGPLWQSLFDMFDPASTGTSLEARYPFIDLRLLRYMLSVPAIPWCRIKYLQREAMRGMLPEPVRRRSKKILRGDPVWDMLPGKELPELTRPDEIQAYVSISRVPKSKGEDRIAFHRDLAPRALDYWMRNRPHTCKDDGGSRRNEVHGQQTPA